MLGKYPACKNPKPRKILCGCIDPRFSEAFEDFGERELGVNRHEDIVMRVGGALTPLAYPNEMPDRCKYLKKQLQFKCRKFPSIEEFIVLSHEDCAYYGEVPEGVLNHYCDDTCGIERRDLPLIGSFLEIVFPQKRIRLYHASFVDNRRHIVFESVPSIHSGFAYTNQQVEQILAIGTRS